jgi:hypothetical protein
MDKIKKIALVIAGSLLLILGIIVFYSFTTDNSSVAVGCCVKMQLFLFSSFIKDNYQK